MPVRERTDQDAARPIVLDEETFTAIWRDTYRKMVGYLRGVAGQAAAEDLTSDTYEKAWTKRDTYNPDAGPVANWLWTIGRRTAIDSYRRRSHRPEADVDPLEAVLADDRDVAELVAHQVDVEAVYSAVQQAMQWLPATYRRALELRFVHGLSVQETAAVTGWPTGTVKSHTSRGLVALRATLQAQADAVPTRARVDDDEDVA